MDETKNVANLSKHGVSFEEAAYAFGDPLQVLTQDRVDEDGEQRWHLIGSIRAVLLVLIVHTVRRTDDGNESLRIISARFVSRQERRIYEIENGLVYS